MNRRTTAGVSGTAGWKASEVKRLKKLEQKNALLNKLLAEAHLDNNILKSALDHLGNG